MKKYSLSDFKGGWIIGNFIPSIIQTTDFEISIKNYHKNDSELKHTHRIATEITIIINGKVLMNNVMYQAGDIILIEPNESTDFKCLDDTVTCVVKIPSSIGDKYSD